jgi:hypothetical protein
MKLTANNAIQRPIFANAELVGANRGVTFVDSLDLLEDTSLPGLEHRLSLRINL